MFYPNKPFFPNLFIVALCLPPMTNAAAGELPQQINQLQTQVMEANEKIATLVSDQLKTAKAISDLKTGLNVAHQEIGYLKSKHKPLVETNAETQRVANGHGR